MTDMEVTKLLGIIFLHVALSFSQDCSPCLCCNGNGCSYNAQLRIDNYCLGGCKYGFMSPQCQKLCVNQRCQTCFTETTCDKCYAGYYGDQCQRSCPSSCNTCTSIKLCTSCRDGFYSGSGSMCIYECKIECLSCTNSTSCTACKVKKGIGYYGSDCSMVCSNKCKDYLCDINGNCLECADPDFIADNCDRCVDGKYGSQCKNNCPVNCISCESATNCTSCTDGFKGTTCSTKTKYPDNCSGQCESCKDGFYGDYCNMTCSQNCMFEYCNQDGSCKAGCEDGFIGSMCDQMICPTNCNCDTSNDCIGCYSNYFGPSCSLTCSSCKDNTCPVDTLNGRCDQGCVDGYSGPFCNISCPKNCKSCHQYNGKCDVCAYDFWGGYCLNNCSDNCTHINESLSSCDIRSGECKYGCLHGTHGSLCNIKCHQKCIASENGVRECRQTDGQCTRGCEAGYKLTTKGCVEEVVADDHGSNGVVGTGVLGGVIALLSVSLALSVGYNVFMKRRQNREHPEKRSASDSRADEEARTYEQLQERTEQPNYQNVKDNGTDNYAVLFADTNM